MMLLEYFVHRYAAKIGKKFGKIDNETMELFRSYDWPGNIRELQNVVERSVVVSSGDVFRVDEAWLSRSAGRVSTGGPEPQPADEDLKHERLIIETALAECRGDELSIHRAHAFRISESNASCLDLTHAP